METINYAYSILLWISVVFLAVLMCACLVRAVLGPRFTDRIVAISVIYTQTIIMIAILSCLFQDKNLLDVAIVYAMIGFLAVVVLSKCYVMPHQAHHVNLGYEPDAERLLHEDEKERPE